MKKIIPFFIVAISFCLMWSCEKESVAPATITTKINPTESYLTNIGTRVLFASLTIDHQAETISGWFIDNRGALRKINHHVAISLRDEIVTGSRVNGLLTNSELVRELDKDELVRHHQQASKVATTRSIETNSDKQTSSAYVSYRLNTEDNAAGHDCSDDHNTDAFSTPTFQQTLLLATGHLNQAASDQVQAINGYLEAFEAEVGN